MKGRGGVVAGWLAGSTYKRKRQCRSGFFATATVQALYRRPGVLTMSWCYCVYNCNIQGYSAHTSIYTVTVHFLSGWLLQREGSGQWSVITLATSYSVRNGVLATELASDGFICLEILPSGTEQSLITTHLECCQCLFIWFFQSPCICRMQ